MISEADFKILNSRAVLHEAKVSFGSWNGMNTFTWTEPVRMIGWQAVTVARVAIGWLLLHEPGDHSAEVLVNKGGHSYRRERRNHEDIYALRDGVVVYKTPILALESWWRRLNSDRVKVKRRS